MDILSKLKSDFKRHKNMYILFVILGFFFINYLYNNDAEFNREANALNYNMVSRGIAPGSRDIVAPAAGLGFVGIITVLLILLPLLMPVLKWLGILILGVVCIFVFGFDLVKTALILVAMFFFLNAITPKKEETW